MILKTHLKPEIRNKLNFLIEYQYWSFERLREHQWQKLEKLLKHAYRNVPYYRELFNKNQISINQLQSFDDLKLIPVTTKKDIRQDFDNMIDENANKHKLLLNFTGGSTGVPLKFYQDQNYLDWAEAARIWHWKYYPGFSEHQKEAILWGADRDLTNTIGLKDFFDIFIRGKNLKLNTFSITNNRFRKFVFLFNLLKPKILRGYASSLLSFSRYLNDNNLSVHPPEKVVSSAELLSGQMRKKIEATLNAKVLDSYGCREVSQIAMECDNQDGLHIAMLNNYAEVEDGKLLISNLNNFAMPFIRYEIGDEADSIKQTKCQCGRSLERIQKLNGRMSDTLNFSGKIVHAEYITHLLYGDTEITRFQVIKNESKNRLKVLIDQPDPRTETKIKESLKSKFPDTSIEISVTQDFIKTSTGKFGLVIDENSME